MKKRRHLRILRDNEFEEWARVYMKRMATKAGIERVNENVYAALGAHVEKKLREVIAAVVEYTYRDNRKMFTVDDVMEIIGIPKAETDFLPLAPTERLIRQLAQKFTDNSRDQRWTRDAIVLLKLYAERQFMFVLNTAYILVKQAKRMTLYPHDIDTAVSIREGCNDVF